MMERILIFIFIILYTVSGTIGKTGFGPGEQEWGFIQVRPGAHMFWWLYYTTANVKSYYDKPLIIWLQSGPGASSTSIGNFQEIGPLDTNLNLRDYTWVKNYNVLFIDNPVGTGFSYVDDETAYATTNAQIANDLLECIRGFYEQLPKFKPVPTYIIAESYGGKMGVEFALVWDRAQRAGTIESNLKGVALGDAWISPIDSVLTWGPYLLSTGVVDTAGFETIDAVAKATKDKVETGKWRDATSYFAYTQIVIDKESYNVDFYNILEKIDYSYHILSQNVSSLDSGTLRWVEKLKWKGANAWHASSRKSLISKNIIEGYFKTYNNFRMYWINRAGHAVPRDNPAAMEIILQDLVNNANQKQKYNNYIVK